MKDSPATSCSCRAIRRPPPEQLVAAQKSYLAQLEAYLLQREPSDVPSAVVDDIAWSALFQNMPEYRQRNTAMLASHPDLIELDARVQQRISTLLRDVRPAYP